MAIWAWVFVSLPTAPSELPLQLCPFCPPVKLLGQPFMPPCLVGRDLQGSSPGLYSPMAPHRYAVGVSGASVCRLAAL